MRILIFSFHYYPDLSAGSFRTFSLVQALLENKNKNLGIDIVTTQPNRYSQFKQMAPNFENLGQVKIYRIRLPRHQNGLLDQAIAFLFYALGAIKIVKNQKYDVIFATTARLMTGALACTIARYKRIPSYLDVRDIFPDVIENILAPVLMLLMRPIFSAVERFTITSAIHVNLVSPGFRYYFEARYSKQSYSCFTNGVDDIFMQYKPIEIKDPHKNSMSPISILYAGNIGEGQGLEKIIPELAKKLKDRANFRIIGAGGRCIQLKRRLQEQCTTNVEIIAPINREKLIHEYQNADVLFLHLNNYDAFKKVLPSKIFEYAATDKPILAGVSGFSKDFIDAEISNASTFHPLDVEAAIIALEKLKFSATNRDEFREKYSRIKIMSQMAKNILSFCR